MPQLISRNELFRVLSHRTLGKELRRRRMKYDLLLSLLRREEEELARDERDAQLLPSPSVPASSAASTAPVVSDAAQARIERIASRQLQVAQMKTNLASFDLSVGELDAGA